MKENHTVKPTANDDATITAITAKFGTRNKERFRIAVAHMAREFPHSGSLKVRKRALLLLHHQDEPMFGQSNTRVDRGWTDFFNNLRLELDAEADANDRFWLEHGKIGADGELYLER